MSELSLSEDILEPDLPIIDAHHHLWHVPRPAPSTADPGGDSAAALMRIYDLSPRYLLDEFFDDTACGHNVRASIFIEAHTMYRAAGPEHLRSVGEIEFANGMAAISASGGFGALRACAGIVGGVELARGDAVAEVLEAQMAAGGDRYRGVRAAAVAFDTALGDLNPILGSRPGKLAETAFRDGFRHLGRFGLHCELWLLESQLGEAAELAKAFPGTLIILNHVGGITGLGGYKGNHAERLPGWRKMIYELAKLPNIAVKLGGLGNPLCGLPSSSAAEPYTSQQLAEEWRPYIETCIEAFGADRCMFESNFPVDKVTASYDVVWNCFKRLTSGASQDEKRALYFGNAERIYRLDVGGAE